MNFNDHKAGKIDFLSFFYVEEQEFGKQILAFY